MKTLVYILIAVLALVCIVTYGTTTQSILRSHEKDRLIEAYNAALYRMWIDNPSYFDDVFTETDEYCNLLELDSTFCHWSFKTPKDSINYEYNYGITSGDPGCLNDKIDSIIDELSRQPLHDKPSPPVDTMYVHP